MLISFKFIKWTNIDFISLYINNSSNSQLTILDLSSNEIEEIGNSPFRYHSNLVELYLQNNYIASVNENIFTNLSNVEHVDLSMNNIVDISPGALLPLKNIKVSFKFKRKKLLKSSHMPKLTYKILLYKVFILRSIFNLFLTYFIFKAYFSRQRKFSDPQRIF